MKITRLVALSAALTCLPLAALAQGKPAPKDALLYFVWPQNGTVIKGGFWARFGLRNMGVTHAGDDFHNSGHHHFLKSVLAGRQFDPRLGLPRAKMQMGFV